MEFFKKSKDPGQQHLWGPSYGHSKRATVRRILAKFDRYYSSLFKCSFLRPGGVILRNSKTKNQQMGVSQPWGKDPGQLAPRKASYAQSNCVRRHRLWATILQKNHIFGLEWCFWEIQKPRIKSLVCFGFGTGFQVIGPPGGQTMAIQRSQDWCFRIFSGGYLFGVFILACCQHNILINRCPPPVLGHHPFLVVTIFFTSNIFCYDIQAIAIAMSPSCDGIKYSVLLGWLEGLKYLNHYTTWAESGI